VIRTKSEKNTLSALSTGGYVNKAASKQTGVQKALNRIIAVCAVIEIALLIVLRYVA
jgi:preprotein translocase subunit SecG